MKPVVAVAVAVCVAAITASALVAGPASASDSPYATIIGSGSSWMSVPADQWAEDVSGDGLTVNFNPDGSAAGRGDYLQGSQVDFALSDVPFRDGRDKLAGTRAEKGPWGYSYVPAVAGSGHRNQTADNIKAGIVRIISLQTGVPDGQLAGHYRI